jgi:hypothetical protein
MNNWPSTTQVLKDFGLYGDIARWSDRAAENREESDACTNPAQRGRVVDSACNRLLMGLDLGVGKETGKDFRLHHATCCMPFVEGYERLLQDGKHKLEPVKCGFPDRFAYEVINKSERYVGHPDQRVILDGVPALFDIKSGSIPPTTDIQTASYLKAERSMDPQNKDLFKSIRVGVQLTRGDYILHYFTDPRVGDEFIILVRAWWIQRKYQVEA